MASPYKALLIWVNELSDGHDSWRGFLYVYLLIFHFTDSGLSVLTGFPFKPHAVYQNTNYRMWNLVGMSNAVLMMLNPSGINFYCNGSFSGSGSKFPFFKIDFSLFTRLPGSG